MSPHPLGGRVRLEIDIERRDRTSDSGDRVTAAYILERPEADWAIWITPTSGRS